MDTAEIIDTAEQENGISDGLLSTSQAMRAANQWGEVSAEGTIEPFNEGGVDSAFQLSGGLQAECMRKGLSNC